MPHVPSRRLSYLAGSIALIAVLLIALGMGWSAISAHAGPTAAQQTTQVQTIPEQQQPFAQQQQQALAHTQATQAPPLYTDCLFLGNSITFGMNLPTAQPLAWIGYLINDLHAQRSYSDCATGHQHAFDASGWCFPAMLNAMVQANYHPVVNLITLQGGEDEFADASGCKTTDVQAGQNATTLLNYVLSTSPNATLVCTDVWEYPGIANSRGILPEAYNTQIEAACRNSGAPVVIITNMTAMYSTNQYHTVLMRNNDGYHPNDVAQAVVADETLAQLP